MPAVKIDPTFHWKFETLGLITPGHATIPLEAVESLDGNDPASSASVSTIVSGGVFGNCLQLTSTSFADIYVPNPAKRIDPLSRFADGYCVDFFFKFPADNGTVFTFFASSDVTMAEPALSLNVGGNGHEVAIFDSPGGGSPAWQSYWVSHTGLADNQWHHYRLCIERSKRPRVLVYIDGVVSFDAEAISCSKVPIIFTGESLSPDDGKCIFGFIGWGFFGTPPYDVLIDGFAVLDTFDPGDGSGDIVVPYDDGSGNEVFETYGVGPLRYSADSVTPNRLWLFDDPGADPIPPDQTDTPDEFSESLDYDGCKESYSARIVAESPAFGDRCLKLEPTTQAANLSLPGGAGTSPHFPIWTRPDWWTYVSGLSVDFRIRFSESGSPDRGFNYELRLAESLLGADRMYVRINRFGYECNFERVGGSIARRTGDFSVSLDVERWYAVRCGIHNSTRGLMTLHLDGVRQMLYEDHVAKPIIFDYASSVRTAALYQRVVEGFAASKHVSIDRLAVVPSFQFADYVVESDPLIFRFRSSATPTVYFDPQDVILVAGNAASFSFDVDDGTSPFTFVVMEGIFPPGLSMDETGNVTGTPVCVGNYTVLMKVIDANGETGQTPVQFVVSKEPYIRYRFGLDTPGNIPSNDPNIPSDNVGNVEGNSWVSGVGDAEIVNSEMGHSGIGGALRTNA